MRRRVWDAVETRQCILPRVWYQLRTAQGRSNLPASTQQHSDTFVLEDDFVGRREEGIFVGAGERGLSVQGETKVGCIKVAFHIHE